MKYAVKIINYLKGVHEIALFETKKEAEKCYDILEALWNPEEEMDEEVLSMEYQAAFKNSVAYCDYWDCKSLELDAFTTKIKNLEYSVNNNGRVSKEISNVVFIKNGDSVYIPA